ncbi:hypothetical protein AKJ16_DCAP07569 [Drosera capensis]
MLVTRLPWESRAVFLLYQEPSAQRYLGSFMRKKRLTCAAKFSLKWEGQAAWVLNLHEPWSVIFWRVEMVYTYPVEEISDEVAADKIGSAKYLARTVTSIPSTVAGCSP